MGTMQVAEEDVTSGVASGLSQGGNGGHSTTGLQDGAPIPRPARKVKELFLHRFFYSFSFSLVLLLMGELEPKLVFVRAQFHQF